MACYSILDNFYISAALKGLFTRTKEREGLLEQGFMFSTLCPLLMEKVFMRRKCHDALHHRKGSPPLVRVPVSFSRIIKGNEKRRGEKERDQQRRTSGTVK